jgi:hypothetical protein
MRQHRVIVATGIAMCALGFGAQTAHAQGGMPQSRGDGPSGQTISVTATGYASANCTGPALQPSPTTSSVWGPAGKISLGISSNRGAKSVLLSENGAPGFCFYLPGSFGPFVNVVPQAGCPVEKDYNLKVTTGTGALFDEPQNQASATVITTPAMSVEVIAGGEETCVTIHSVPGNVYVLKAQAQARAAMESDTERGILLELAAAMLYLTGVGISLGFIIGRREKRS